MNAPKVIANLVAAIGERIRFYRSARGWWIEIVTRRRHEPKPVRLGNVVRV